MVIPLKFSVASEFPIRHPLSCTLPSCFAELFDHQAFGENSINPRIRFFQFLPTNVPFRAHTSQKFIRLQLEITDNVLEYQTGQSIINVVLGKLSDILDRIETHSTFADIEELAEDIERELLKRKKHSKHIELRELELSNSNRFFLLHCSSQLLRLVDLLVDEPVDEVVEGCFFDLFIDHYELVGRIECVDSRESQAMVDEIYMPVKSLDWYLNAIV